MTAEEARQANVAWFLGRAGEALESARAEAAAGRTAFAMNRAYYACFYAASAVLLHENLHFVKHAGLRAGIHRHLVKTGRLHADMARIFDDLMTARHEGDYGPVDFSAQDVADAIARAERFVAHMKSLLPPGIVGHGGE